MVRWLRNSRERSREPIILQLGMQPTWGFDDLPDCVKEEAEMRMYCVSKEVYDIYGVDVKKGAIVLVET